MNEQTQTLKKNSFFEDLTANVELSKKLVDNNMTFSKKITLARVYVNALEKGLMYFYDTKNNGQSLSFTEYKTLQQYYIDFHSIVDKFMNDFNPLSKSETSETITPKAE